MTSYEDVLQVRAQGVLTLLCNHGYCAVQCAVPLRSKQLQGSLPRLLQSVENSKYEKKEQIYVLYYITIK